MQRLADRVLVVPSSSVVALTVDSPAVERAVMRTLESDGMERLVAQMVDSPGMERIIACAVESPGMQRIVTGAVQSPGMERVVASVFESRLLDEVVERLLASEELWRLVDEVARSPAVTDAVTQQTAGFADQVAVDVRNRSRSGDELLERTTRRLLRRRPRPDPPAGPLTGPPGPLIHPEKP